MTRISSVAAMALLALLATSRLAHAQAATAPNAAVQARLAKLKAKQDAIIAAAKARAAASAAPTATVTPPPVVTAPPKATTAPTTTAPAATGSVKPVASAPPATSGSAVPAAALLAHTGTAAIALDLDALKKTRPDRRHAEFLDLQARFGNLLSDPRASAELKQHAQRIAYLQRVRALGVKANDANFVKSVDALITTEETRDANTLNSFRTGALPVPVPVPAAAAAVAAPVAAGGSK